jgi:hypothetical protein
MGLVLAAASLAQMPQDQAPSSPAVTKQFRPLEQRVGGRWQALWNPATNTPSAIYGTGLLIDDWRENTLAEARRHANRVLAEHADLLQLGASEFREAIGARMGRTWSFVFDQHFRGLPCIGGRADVRVNMRGVVAMLGSTAWQVPADFDVTPTIDAQQARASAWLALRQAPTGVRQPVREQEPRLVIWGDVHATDAAPFFLAWEVPISNVDRTGAGPIGRYYIDARTGAVLHFTTDKHECGAGCVHVAASASGEAPAATAPAAGAVLVPTTVTVMAWTRTAQSAIAPLANIPLEGLVVTVPGLGTRTTDANGQFSIDIAAPVTISVTTLDGLRCDPIQDPTGNQPNASVVVQPGVAATLQLLAGGATPEQAAHTSSLYWVHAANEWSRTILGNSAELATADGVDVTVNRSGNCNAYYTANSINFYPTAGSCNNTAFSTVIVHEWGHGLDDRYGGISNASGDGLSEGWGDILGMYIVDNPVVGLDFQTGGNVRTGLNGTMYGTQSEVHAAGEVWMGFAWRLRDNLRSSLGTPQAIAISNDIVIGSIVADATNQANAVIEVFVADDDDGNLANGVPHYAELSAAAITKGMPYPQIQVAFVNHAPLADTTDRLVPRLVTAVAGAVSSGSITQVRLFYSVNGGAQQTRTMFATGNPDEYRALLPGVTSGLVTYHLEATHSSSTVVRTPPSGEIAYTVTAAPIGPFAGFYAETFDSGAAGWTHVRVSGFSTDDWQLGAPNGKSSTVSGVFWSDPAAAVSGTSVYGTDLGAGTSNGRYPNNMNYYLRSPVINCSGRTGVHLRFDRWLTVEEGIYDRATIAVNGVEVWANPELGHLVDSAWQSVEYAIPMADNNPSVQIEFRLVTDAGLNLGGWNIDNVEVGTRPTAPLDTTLTFLPEQAGPGTPMTLTVDTTAQQVFAVAFAPTAGPTLIPGLPPILVGPNPLVLSGVTDASGVFTANLLAPSFPAPGLLWYGQALTIDAAATFKVSNQHLNLLTP